MIRRREIAAVIANLEFDDDTTADERNELRREAVKAFLADKPNRAGPQGSEHDMILSDLQSYPEWEREEDGGRAQKGNRLRKQGVPDSRSSRLRPDQVRARLRERER